MALKYRDMELEPAKQTQKNITILTFWWVRWLASYIEEQYRSVYDEPSLVDARQASQRNAVERHLATNRPQSAILLS